MSEAVKEDKAHPLSDYTLKLGILGSEPCTPEMRSEIEKNLGIYVSDNYGMTELGGPGVSGDCPVRDGMHFAEDHFLPEIVDPETGAVLQEGEAGELVVTTLTRRGMPVLRYRTKDITRLNYEPCACGRTHVRMAKTMGRTDDMLIIKGVNVFPTQIESVLIGIDHIGPHYQLVVRRENFKDTLEIKVELVSGDVLESYGQLEALRNEISAKMRSVLGLQAKITLGSAQDAREIPGQGEEDFGFEK